MNAPIGRGLLTVFPARRSDFGAWVSMKLTNMVSRGMNYPGSARTSRWKTNDVDVDGRRVSEVTPTASSSKLLFTVSVVIQLALHWSHCSWCWGVLPVVLLQSNYHVPTDFRINYHYCRQKSTVFFHNLWWTEHCHSSRIAELGSNYLLFTLFANTFLKLYNLRTDWFAKFITVIKHPIVNTCFL